MTDIVERLDQIFVSLSMATINLTGEGDEGILALVEGSLKVHKEAAAEIERLRNPWVPIEDIENHISFKNIEDCEIGPPIAMCVLGSEEWQMVRTTNKHDYNEDDEPLIPAVIFTYDEYVDIEFIRDCVFTHFCVLSPPKSPKP